MLGSSTRRGAWVVLDQALSSLTNFGLSVLVLRSVGPAEFGAFTIGFMAYMVALYVCRAISSQPQLVRYSNAAHEEWRKGTEEATGLSLLLGAVGALPLIIVSVLIGGLIGNVLLPLALFLPFLLLQDAWRFSFFAQGTPAKAFFNDLVWLVAQMAFVGMAVASGDPGVGLLMAAWAAAAAVGALVGCWQAHLVPRPARALRYLVAHKDIGPRFTAEIILGLLAWQCVTLAVGAIAGLTALGTLNAGRVVLGPFNAITLGAIGFAVPEGSAIWKRAPSRLEPAVWAFGAALGLSALGCTALAMLLPREVGIGLFGSTWPAARSILPIVGVWVALEGAAQGPRLGLMALSSAKAILRARVITAPLVLIGGAVGAAADGARGAALGLLAAHLVSGQIWWRAFRSTCRTAVSARNGGDIGEDPAVKERAASAALSVGESVAADAGGSLGSPAPAPNPTPHEL